VAGTIVLAPCFPIPEEPPQLPGGPDAVLAPKFIMSGLDVLLPEDIADAGYTCDEQFSQLHDRRAWAWCHFVELVRPMTGGGWPLWEGKPRFESFVPQAHALAHGAYVWLSDPDSMSIWDKRTMYEPGLVTGLSELGYRDGCKMAARSHYCEGAESHWMPRFKSGQRMIKTFWVDQHQLPAGSDPSNFYSYDPPGTGRKYLVGLHINVTHPYPGFEEFYFRWITLWVPAPPGVTTTIGGESLDKYYNFNCTEGHGFDKPAELTGTIWSRYAMCTNWSGYEPCGNPWGPKNECMLTGDQGCIGCHATMGRAQLGPSVMELELGWLTGLGAQVNAGKACLDEILANPGYYENKAACWMGSLDGPGPLNDGWPD
jgi:hypothetical protein